MSKFCTKAMFTMFSMLLSSILGDACTEINLVAKDGSHIHGRTAEFGIKLDLSTLVIPRGYQFSATVPQGKGLSYQAKYAAAGIMAFQIPAIIDGLNEKGLAVGAFYFPGYAEYSQISSENQGKALSPIDFPNWVLTQFATIDEVKAGLQNVVIAPSVVDGWGPKAPPFHYIVIDQSGKSIVIEPIKGKLVIQDNKLGIITNSPTFDWHMTNLTNYVNLTPFNVKPVKLNGVEFIPFGEGSGMVGLPGDFSPPSRFVRATIFSFTAIPSKDAQETVLQAFHILNQFDIPIGVVREVDNGVVYTDQTLATAVRDPQLLKYYFKTYEDQTIKFVDLKKFDLNAKDLKRRSIGSKQTFVDVSLDLN